MGDIGLSQYLMVGAVLFVCGVVCMATKRNVIGVLMGGIAGAIVGGVAGAGNDPGPPPRRHDPDRGPAPGTGPAHPESRDEELARLRARLAELEGPPRDET